MASYCYKCGQELDLGPNRKVARGDECPHCRVDMHCCFNCRHYDQSAYNECRESQAERVLDKNRRNFCDYFEFREGRSQLGAGSGSAALKKLDDLFKK